MKNLISFITLLIFILNISHNAISAEVKDDVLPDPVVDQDGNELKTGNSYYLRPVFRPGGGVTIYPLANETCTFGVVQLLFGDGLPVTFGNGGTDLGEVIRESTDLTIEFTPGILFCGTAWKVDKYDEATGQYFVISADDDGSDTSINKWFQIRRDSLLGSYRFAFCPKVSKIYAQICTNVGIYTNEGVRRFALEGTFPSSFTFMKDDRNEIK